MKALRSFESSVRWLLLVLLAATAGCGGRGKRGPTPEQYARELSKWLAEESAALLPAGGKVVVWVADPPRTAQGPAVRLGEACEKAFRDRGFEVVVEAQEWPEAPILDADALQDLQRRHAPAAVAAISAGVLLDERAPAPSALPLVIVLQTRPDPRVEQWANAGLISLALLPNEQASPSETRSLRERFRVVKPQR